MKRLLFLIAILTSFVAAQAQPAAPKRVVADKIIAVVGNKIVLKSDIDNGLIDMQRQGIEIPPNAYCATLEQALGVKALVLQAEKDSLPVSDEEVEAAIDNQIRYFMSQYGSKDELERVAGKSVYQLKEDFKDGFRDNLLAKAMRNKVVDGVRITPAEVQKYFDAIPTDSLPLYETEVEVGQIIAYPKATREAEEYAIEQLKTFKQQIESGKKDFCSVAAINSEDPGSKDNCGKYEVNRNSKELDKDWLQKAFALKEGQISAPFKTRFGYHIIQLVSRAGDDATVRHILLVPKVSTIEIRAVVDRLDSVRSRMMAGTLVFNDAVNRYSEDEASKFNAGRVAGRDGSTSVTIDQLDKDMVAMMKNLKVGQYSQPVEFTDERGKKGVRIVYLQSKSEPHRENMRDDYDKIAQRALEEKKNGVLENWFAKKIPSYYVMIADEYKNCPELKKWTTNSATSAIVAPTN
jgi:peptidyl-prolyl cis-trans isomerase SurA